MESNHEKGSISDIKLNQVNFQECDVHAQIEETALRLKKPVPLKGGESPI